MQDVHSFHVDGVSAQDDDPRWKFMMNVSRTNVLSVPYLDIDPADVDLVYDAESERSFLLGASPAHSRRYVDAIARGEDNWYAYGILLSTSQVLHGDCEGRFGDIVASYTLID